MKTNKSFGNNARLLCAVIAAISLLSLTACQNNEPGGGELTTRTTESTEAPTEAPSEAPTEAPTNAPAVSFPTTGWATDSLNVRSGPGTDYRGIGGLTPGEEVQILAQEGDWYKIQIRFKDEVGYVSAQYIQFTPFVPAATTQAEPTATTTTAAVQ